MLRSMPASRSALDAQLVEQDLHDRLFAPDLINGGTEQMNNGTLWMLFFPLFFFLIKKKDRFDHPVAVIF